MHSPRARKVRIEKQVKSIILARIIHAMLCTASGSRVWTTHQALMEYTDKKQKSRLEFWRGATWEYTRKHTIHATAKYLELANAERLQGM